MAQYGAAGKETHTAAYEPFRRHSSRAVPADPAEAARAAGGCPVRRARRPVASPGWETAPAPPSSLPRDSPVPLSMPYDDAGESNPVASMASSPAGAATERKIRGKR